MTMHRRETDPDEPERERERPRRRRDVPAAPWTLHRKSGTWSLYANAGLWAVGDGEEWCIVPAERVDWWLGEFGLTQRGAPMPAGRW